MLDAELRKSRFFNQGVIQMTRAMLLTALLGVIGLLSFTGCNTLEGMGEDTQAAGEEIEEAAE